MLPDVLSQLPIVLAGVGGVVWAVRLEGRVNIQDKLFVEREKQLTARQEADTERHTDLKDRLVRIEAGIDRLMDAR